MRRVRGVVRVAVRSPDTGEQGLQVQPYLDLQPPIRLHQDVDDGRPDLVREGRHRDRIQQQCDHEQAGPAGALSIRPPAGHNANHPFHQS